MPPLVSGDTFESLQDFKAALRQWAIEANFTPLIRDSDAHRVRAGCRSSPDCPFRIRCNFRDGVAKVSKVTGVHNCTSGQNVSQDIKRTEVSKLQFLLDTVPQIMDVEPSTNPMDIVEAIKAKYGQEIALRQAQKVRSALCPKPREKCQYCGAATHRNPASRKLEPCPQAPNPANSTVPSQNEPVGMNDTGMQAYFQDDSMQMQPPMPMLGGHSMQQDSRNNPMPQPPQIQAIAPSLLQPTQNPIRAPPPPQASRNPRDPRLEASRLMHTAARLMQQAANMNMEAAQLMAGMQNM